MMLFGGAVASIADCGSGSGQRAAEAGSGQRAAGSGQRAATAHTWVIGCAIRFGLPMTCTMRNHANCRVALWTERCNGSAVSTLCSGHITSQHRCRAVAEGACRETPLCEYDALQEALKDNLLPLGVTDTL